MSDVTSWSLTAANNNSAAPNGAPEGMAPSGLNDTIRENMRAAVKEFQINAVKVLASVAGTDTITASMTPDLTAYSSGMIVVLTPANNNTGAATLNIDSLGAKSIVKGDGAALEAGDLQASTTHLLVYDGTNFVCLNPLAFSFPSLSVSGAVTLNGALTTDNSSADEAGFKGIPQNSQSANYTLVLADAGKHIVHPSGGGSGDTFTIPANSSVAYPVGTVLTFINADSNSISIAITTDTMTLAGSTTTGTRTLAQNGIATAVKIASTSWIISGTALA